MKSQFYFAGQPVSGWVHSTRSILAIVALILITSAARASDPIGVFALVDKVVLEPNDTKPERIQIWGKFVLADGDFGDNYKAPVNGYLYYQLPAEKPEVALKEWADIRKMAGQREVIGFGTRRKSKVTVRKAAEKPAAPDTYQTGFGLVRTGDRPAGYGPIVDLLRFARTASLR